MLPCGVPAFIFMPTFTPDDESVGGRPDDDEPGAVTLMACDGRESILPMPPLPLPPPTPPLMPLLVPPIMWIFPVEPTPCETPDSEDPREPPCPDTVPPINVRLRYMCPDWYSKGEAW